MGLDEMTMAERADATIEPGRVPLVPETDFVRVRLAGDSGDGIQLTGARVADAAADFGNDFATFPDYPAEIRAPAGTTYGVSSFSINFGRTEILTHGDQPDVLVAFNPAALKTHIGDLKPGGLVIIDSGTFTPRNLTKAGYDADPRRDDCLAAYRVIEIDMSALTLAAVKEHGIGQRDSLRCKNVWALGLLFWLFDRDRAPVTSWLAAKFKAAPAVAAANIAALNAGHAYGETAEFATAIPRYDIAPAALEVGTYRTVTGSEALSLGLIAAAKLSARPLLFASYPITPASPLLHALAREGDPDVMTFQAEDEIAAACAAIGASYAGRLGVTASSGPGIALKTEAIGLAISTELPLLIVDVQRGGPSTGLPTKTEQSDLFQAVFGRNGDAPLPVLAATRPADCFATTIEAARIALNFMTPVMLLSDGYIANMAEPWRLPAETDPLLAPFGPRAEDIALDGFHPFRRDTTTLARNWAAPGMAGFEHRIGGLEKDFDSGNVSYDPANHQRMSEARIDKIARIADYIPEQRVDLGTAGGRLAIVGWGSTYGAIRIATLRARVRGLDVSHIHLRHLWPLPRNLGALFDRFDQILVPEMNAGQLITLLRSRFDRPFRQLNKISGQPFQVTEIGDAIARLLERAP